MRTPDGRKLRGTVPSAMTGTIEVERWRRQIAGSILTVLSGERRGSLHMTGKTSRKSKVAKKAAAKPVAAKAVKPRKVAARPALLAGGNPQIAKADGDTPVQAYIAAMPGWKRDV